MKYQLNFGRVTATAGQGSTSTADTGRFRIALLGDFSGRANSGRVETGVALARRRPLVVDVDNLDDVISRLGITRPTTNAGYAKPSLRRCTGTDLARKEVVVKLDPGMSNWQSCIHCTTDDYRFSRVSHALERRGSPGLFLVLSGLGRKLECGL
ncbi:MAG: hypothetical protein KDA60_04055 [Planctomycetales bacterium]|nr:hypothetical protein [Planctomycetales bacterium]